MVSSRLVIEQMDVLSRAPVTVELFEASQPVTPNAAAFLRANRHGPVMVGT